jgi:transposase
MIYRTGDRDQVAMLPHTIEEYVGEDDPVRAYDAIIEVIETKKLNLKFKETKVGNKAYHPVTMLKILIYAYSYGWRSSRKIERALHHNLSFIWLAGGIKPNFKTISKFRKDNVKTLKSLMKQCAGICIDLNLIEGNTLFTDGCKIRAYASINQTKSKKKWKEILENVEEKIDQLFQECDKLDLEEKGSLVKLEDEIKDNKKLQKKVKSLIDKMEQEGLEKINGTDSDCINFKSRQGSHAGYNAQMTVDEKNGLIVNADVVAVSNDLNQFAEQIKQSNEVLGKKCKTACADAGYSNISNLKESVKDEIDVVVPTQKQASHNKVKQEPFSKENFKYDKKNNQYFCPEEKILRFSHYSKTKKNYLYRMQTPDDCFKCGHYGACTTSKRGRTITRLKDEELKEQLEERYLKEDGQAIYKKRKEKVELPFGHFKNNLNIRSFLVKGLESVKGEFAIMANCFNIVRMITLLGGVGSTIAEIKKIGA